MRFSASPPSASRVFGMPKAEELGPAYTFTEAMTMPEFGLGGRLDFYSTPSPTNWAWNQIMGLGWLPSTLLAFGAAVIAAWLTGQRRLLHFAAWVMLAVGLGWWLALRLFPDELMFGLYVPNRHARWVIGTFGIVALAAAGYGVLQVVLQPAHARTAAARDRMVRRRGSRREYCAAAAALRGEGAGSGGRGSRADVRVPRELCRRRRWWRRIRISRTSYRCARAAACSPRPRRRCRG